MKQVLTALCVLFFLVSCASVPGEGMVPTMMAPTQAASPTATSTATSIPTGTPVPTYTHTPQSTATTAATRTTAPSATSVARLATLAPVATIAPIVTQAPVVQPTQAPTKVQPTQAPAVGGCPNGCVSSSPTCQIKGNISSSGEKIYHVPGGASYNATAIDPNAGERWFCTGAEALANGWRAAAR